MVTACVAPRRSIRQERAEKRSGAYGRGPRRRGRAPGRDPKGGAFHDHGEKAGLEPAFPATGWTVGGPSR